MPRTLIDDRYELRILLGSGGMADVFLAHDEVLDRDVALKVLKEHYAQNQEFVKRFIREAQSAAAALAGFKNPARQEKTLPERRRRSRPPSRATTKP